MNNTSLTKLLERLEDTPKEERHWVVTIALLESLPGDLREAVLAAAIPHWFDAPILAELLDKSVQEAAKLYEKLQQLSFVKKFYRRANNAHNIHESTRQLIIKYLCQQNYSKFKTLSAKAASYFATLDPDPIERLYHLAASDSQEALKELYQLVNQWNQPFQKNKLESLIKALENQIKINQICNVNTDFLADKLNKLKQRLYLQDIEVGKVNNIPKLSGCINSKISIDFLDSPLDKLPRLMLVYTFGKDSIDIEGKPMEIGIQRAELRLTLTNINVILSNKNELSSLCPELGEIKKKDKSNEIILEFKHQSTQRILMGKINEEIPLAEISIIDPNKPSSIEAHLEALRRDLDFKPDEHDIIDKEPTKLLLTRKYLEGNNPIIPMKTRGRVTFSQQNLAALAA